MTQARATGGIHVQADENMHIDPGPGALIAMKKYNLDPTKTRTLIVSHCHTDHYSDAEVLVEAMTNGGTQKRGSIYGSESVIKGGYHNTIKTKQKNQES